jgi:hypothetical protein
MTHFYELAEYLTLMHHAGKVWATVDGLFVVCLVLAGLSNRRRACVSPLTAPAGAM